MRLVLTYLVLLSAGVCLAAPPTEFDPNYHVRNWQIEDGLPQNNVQKITQTADGYLWLATPNALARFDGRTFKVFNRADVATLRTNSITCLYGDRAGRLWIGAKDHLVCYAQGEFTAYTPPNPPAWGEFTGVAEDPSGALFALTVWGLCRIDPAQLRLAPMPNPLGRDARLAADSHGQIWISTGNTLCRLEANEWPVQHTFPYVVHSLVVDRDDVIWCGLNNGVIIQINHQNPPRQFKLGERTVTQIVTLDHNEIFFCMERRLHRFPGGEAARLSLPNGSRVGQILDAFKDREGNLWIGTEGDGLLALHWKPLQNFSVEEGLDHRYVTTIMEDRLERVWAGTLGTGAAILTDGRWKAFDFPVKRAVGALRETRDGSLWFATFGRHLWRIENNHPQLETRSRALAGRALFEDADGALWIGGDGMGIECLQNKQMRRYDTGRGLLTDETRCFAQTRNGDCWAGTAQGLYRIRNDKVLGFFTRDGIGDNTICALCVDIEGTLWIGTEGGGLSRFRDGRFSTINTQHGLLDNTVAQILEDDHGYLWLGTNRGLLRVNRAELNQALDGAVPRVSGRAFDKADGMRNLQCTAGFQPNCMKSRDGRLWFATVDGVAMVDPKLLPISQVPPPVHIERLVVDGLDLLRERTEAAFEPSPATERSRTLPSFESGRPTETIVSVPPGAKRLEIHYTGISFSGIDRLRFKYRLAGYDHEWNEADALRMASYTRVPPGSYEFHVQAANGDGIWNAQGARLAFVVRPQFWQTWWFRGTAALATAALISALACTRIHRRRQIEQLRLRIARDLHDEVGSNLGIIALYNQFAQAKTREGSSPSSEFQEIDSVVQRTAQSLRDVIWFTNPEFDTLGGMLQHMEDAAGRTLVGKTVIFESEPPETVRHLAVEFRRNVFFIFRELMHNVVKHSQARRVCIRLSEEKRRLILEVEDDGIGFDPAGGRKGHGLNNMTQRAAELGGALEITSRPGHGTTARLSVPMT